MATEVRSAMPVYMIIEIEVKDYETYSQYVQKVQAIVETHGGRYLARGGRVTSLSGGWDPERIIVIEFGTREEMGKCFPSPEYVALAPVRERSTASRAIVVDGYAPDERDPHRDTRPG